MFERDGHRLAGEHDGSAGPAALPTISATLAADIAELTPGVALAAHLDAAMRTLPSAGRVEGEERAVVEEAWAAVVAGWARMASWVAAQQHTALVGFAGPTPPEETALDLGPVAVGAVLHLPPRTAEGRVDDARRLVADHPATLETLREGAMTDWQARTILELCAGRDPAVSAKVEADVLPKAATRTGGEFRRLVRAALLRHDPGHDDGSPDDVSSKRSMRWFPNEDGTSTLETTLPGADGRFVWDALSAEAYRLRDAAKAALAAAKEAARAAGCPLAPAEGGDERPDKVPGIDVFRSLVLVQWAARAMADPDAPTPRGVPVSVGVVIDLPTLLGLANNPGEIIGYGPIHPDVARVLAADGTWRRLVVDPVEGHLLDYGQTTYRPPKKLADYLRQRDCGCTFPHCGQPASRTEQDHMDPYPRPGDPPGTGGGTSAREMHSPCKYHHDLHTHHGWTIKRRANGGLRWTSPHGLAFDSPPRRVLP